MAVQDADYIWRDFEVDGVSSSGYHKPILREQRVWGTWVETAIDAGLSNGGLIYDTKAHMDADLVHDANASAWVIGDSTVANNGIYRKSGASGSGSWTRVGDLPYSFIKASNAGAGTANAIQATTSIPVPAADGAALVTLNITANNTGAATVSFNGGSALTIKTASGADVQADYLVAGSVVSGFVVGSTFQLTSEVGTAAAAAAAQAAADAAAESAASIDINKAYVDERTYKTLFDYDGVADGTSTTENDALVSDVVTDGEPVLVPISASGFAFTSLSDDFTRLLFGPGKVLVGGVVQRIPSSAQVIDNEQAVSTTINNDLQPTSSGGFGAVGKGARWTEAKRTGGYHLYGLDGIQYTVTDENAAGEFDVARTEWSTATNLTGGVIFGGWTGANTPHSNGGTFSAGFAVAREYNVGNRWADFGFQTDDGSRATKGVTSGPDVVPTKDEDPGKTVTFTGGTPGVVTHAEHGMVKGTSVKFTTSDALPTGISAGAVYYIDPIDADSYYLIDGRRQAASHKDFTGGGMGTHKAFPQWPGTFAFQVIGSVAGHQWWTGYHIRPGKIKHGGVGALWWGGIATDDDQPLYALDLRGYWQNVFNLKSAIFSGKIFDLNSAQRTQIAVDLKIGAVETTSTALASASDAINTAGKFSGKLALAIDTGVVYVALGSSATANWRPFTMGTGLTPA